MKDRVTIPAIRQRKGGSIPIAALTAYDACFAKLFDEAGIDLLLVGDSVASVIQGEETTLPVTLDEMVYHTRCVSRAVRHALVVADMPFLSYQVSTGEAIRSAGRLIKEGGAAAVKLEGGLPFQETVARLVEIDIPVMGHVGLTPQSYHRMGGHKVQGRKRLAEISDMPGSAARILQDAKALDEAGVFAVAVEGVPEDLARQITETISVPTIGIGAGGYCDGQILVMHDMLGLHRGFVPRFVKQFATLGDTVEAAARQYIAEVQTGAFPAQEHTFGTARPRSEKKKSSGSMKD